MKTTIKLHESLSLSGRPHSGNWIGNLFRGVNSESYACNLNGVQLYCEYRSFDVYFQSW